MASDWWLVDSGQPLSIEDLPRLNNGPRVRNIKVEGFRVFWERGGKSCSVSAGVSAALSNANGRLAYAFSPNSVMDIHSYDQMGRTTDVWQCVTAPCPSAWHAQHTFDLGGDLLTSGYNGAATLNFTYDNTQRLTGVTRTGSGLLNLPPTLLSNVTYYPVGMHTATLGNGLSEVREYNPRTWLSSLTVGSSPVVYSLMNLTYSGNGDVLTANDSANQNWTYAYDAFNRLSQATNTSTNPNLVYQYLYDRFGNRWQQNQSQGSNYQIQLTFNSNNQINGIIPAPPAGNPFRYDAAGNLMMDVLNCYTYDAENRLSSVAPQTGSGSGVCGATTMSYLYDPDGRRVARLQNGQVVKQYYYDAAGNMITEADASGNTLRAEIYAGSRHLATWNPTGGGTTYFNHADWLGTERARTNSSGGPCETITSLPFGDGEVTSGGCTPTPTFFTGKERDSESGLDYFSARYYGSNLGRWMSPDWASAPTAVPYAEFGNPQSLNLYGYVGNNPLSHADPDGHCCDLDDVLNFVAGAVNAYSSDNLLGAFRVDQHTEAGQVGAAVGDAVATVQGAAEATLGAGGEVAGVVLDATGVGAVVGVPANVVSAGLIAHGTVTAGEGYIHLAKSTTSGETDAAARGREAHKNYEPGPGYNKEVKLPEGRADAVNTKEGVVRELKPNNPSAIKKGQRQVERYRQQLQRLHPRRKWKGKVDTYD